MGMYQCLVMTMVMCGLIMGSALAQTPAPAFQSSTPKIAAWNLQGFTPITQARVQEQVEALKILDADVIALVEVHPVMESGWLGGEILVISL